jgi:hypothetical protein
MNTIIEIGISLIAAFIGFLIGWVWQRIKLALRLRRARRFWKPFTSDPFQIVLGRFLDFSQFEPSGLMGVGDAIALKELSSFFQLLGVRDFGVEYADRIEGELLKSNLILIGGPDSNAISREVVSRISTSLQFGNPKLHEIALFDSISQKTYMPLTDSSSGHVIRDYSMIIKTVNPFAPDKMLILLAGCFGYASWAGVRFITSKAFLEHPIVSTGVPVECLIQADFVNETPQDMKIITVRKLAMERRPELSVPL